MHLRKTGYCIENSSANLQQARTTQQRKKIYSTFKDAGSRKVAACRVIEGVEAFLSYLNLSRVLAT